jgi:hypothetical protein
MRPSTGFHRRHPLIDAGFRAFLGRFCGQDRDTMGARIRSLKRESPPRRHARRARHAEAHKVLADRLRPIVPL